MKESAFSYLRQLRKALARLWRWSWLLTLPCAALFLAWSEAVLSRYWEFGLRYQLLGEQPSQLYRIGKMELDHGLRLLSLATRKESDRTWLRRIDLFIPEASEKQLGSNLPYSGKHYRQAWMLSPEGDVDEVEVKYRGDFWWHWAYYKKSLRVKTKKKQLFEGMRRFNLIAPKFKPQINNLLAYRLATQLQLLAPRSELVNLRVNGRNRGLHLLVEQIDESTLRHNRRMPGDVYSGEMVALDQFEGIPNRLFMHPRVWEKVAVNNHYPEDSFAPMDALNRALFPLNGDEEQLLGQLLEAEIWGRFLAFEILAQTIHFSDAHNWRLYYDPAKSVFEPIVWDANGWHSAWTPKEGQSPSLDIMNSRLHRRLLLRHEFLAARQMAIEEFFADGHDQSFLDEVSRVIDQVERELGNDPHLVAAFDLMEPAHVMREMLELRRTIERVFDGIRDAYTTAKRPIQYSLEESTRDVHLTIDDRRAPAALQLEYENPLENRVLVSASHGCAGESVPVDISGATSIQGRSLNIDVSLLPAFVPVDVKRTKKGFDVSPGNYVLHLDGISSQNSLRDLYARYSHGDMRLGSRVDRSGQLEDDCGMPRASQLIEPRPVESTIVWKGEKTIDGVEIIQGDLAIEPGTAIRLTKGSSLILRGRVMARGTAAQPIRFLPAQADEYPWGAVVLEGDGADGSILEHCEFGYGSGYKTDLFEYMAMLSLHDVEGVLVSNCYFHDSQVVDDMFHAVYGSVVIKSSIFENSLFDAVDLDIVEGVVDGCVFKGSGNDALDLMSSQVVVVNSQMIGSADKGISVGEGTTLFAANNLLRENNIGLESKDSSVAHVYNTSFDSNQKALNAYQKNWRYGDGGTINLLYAKVNGPGEVATADRRSRINISRSKTGSGLRSSKRVTVQRKMAEVLPDFARDYASTIEASRFGWQSNEK